MRDWVHMESEFTSVLTPHRRKVGPAIVALMVALSAVLSVLMVNWTERTSVASSPPGPRFILNDPEFTPTAFGVEASRYVLEKDSLRVSVDLYPGDDQITFENDGVPAPSRPITLAGGISATLYPANSSEPCRYGDWYVTWVRNDVSFEASGCDATTDEELSRLLGGLRTTDQGRRLRPESIASTYSVTEFPGARVTTFTRGSESVKVAFTPEEIESPVTTTATTSTDEPVTTPAGSILCMLDYYVEGKVRSYGVYEGADDQTVLTANFTVESGNVKITAKVSEERLVELADRVSEATPEQWHNVEEAIARHSLASGQRKE